MLDRDDADYYASKFVRHDLSLADLPDLNQSVLREVGVHRMGHVMAILKHAKEVKDSAPPARGGRSSNRRQPAARDSSSSSESSKSPSPPPRRSRSSNNKRKEAVVPVRARKGRKASPSSSEASSSEASSRSPSPPPKKKKSPGSKVAHIDRTTAKKQPTVTKLDDDDLLAASIELPARFKTKQSKPSILQQAMTSGGPTVTRKFKEDPEMAKKYGKTNGGGISYVNPEFTKQTVVRPVLKKSNLKSSPTKDFESKLRPAAMDSVNADRDKRDGTSSVFARLSVNNRERESNSRESNSKSPQKSTAKKTTSSDKVVDPIAAMQRRLSLASATSRRSSDGKLEKIEHKESRHGKSVGLFANEGNDFDKFLNSKRSDTANTKDRRNSGGIEARLGRSKRERSRSPVKSSIQDRLGDRR